MLRYELLIHVEKKPGEIVGVGNTATVYEWECGKVVKLFHEGYPYQAAIREFENAIAVNDMDFPKPKAYEFITYKGKHGIVYDKVNVRKSKSLT